MIRRKIIKILILIIIFGLILNGLALLITGKNIVDLTKYLIASVVRSVTQLILVISPAPCGNGIKEPGEECDGADLAGQTCLSLGFAGGTLACKPDCTFDTSGCIVILPPPPPPLILTRVILEGWAYPKSKVTILKDGQKAAEVYANSKAEFKAEIPILTSGIYTFGIWAEDTDGRRSITYSLTFYVRADTITKISGIFLPPTIELGRDIIPRGEILDIFGQTVPLSEVEVHISSLGQTIVEKTPTNEFGVWLLAFNTQPLEEGLHAAKSRSIISPETISGFGHVLGFIIRPPIPPLCARADLNKDGKVNLIDFSILMYYWGTANPLADINQDGIVNLTDFSIMMYCWTPVVKIVACPGADLNRDGRVNLIDFSILMYYWGTDNACADQNQDGLVNLFDFSIMMYYWTG